MKRLLSFFAICAMIFSINTLSAQSSGWYDLILEIHNSSNYAIEETTVPFGGDWIANLYLENSNWEDNWDDFYGVLDIDISYYDEDWNYHTISTKRTQNISLPAGRSTTLSNFTLLTAAEIAENDLYGAKYVCVEAYNDDWLAISGMNVWCLDVLFYAQDAGSDHVISVVNTDGSVTPSGNVIVGDYDDQTFVINVPPCKNLQDVKVDGVSVLGNVVNNTYTFNNVSTNHTFEVTYSTQTYTVNATAGEHGTISPTNTIINCGDSYVFSIRPDAGYQIFRVTDNSMDVTSSVSNNTYTLVNITEGHNIFASFVSTTGVDNYENESSISIYPNPANDLITIAAPMEINYVEIYDVTGKMVSHVNVNDTHIDLNISELTNGIYFTKTLTNNQLIVNKIIKK